MCLRGGRQHRRCGSRNRLRTIGITASPFSAMLAAPTAPLCRGHGFGADALQSSIAFLLIMVKLAPVSSNIPTF
jgi:hypothetical protein